MAYHGFKPASQAIQIGADEILSSHISDGVIVNDDINSSAAIAVTKTLLAGGTGITLSTNTLNVDASQTQITSVGTIGTGVWNASVIASAKLDADTAHLSEVQTFSGAKTFSALSTHSSDIYIKGGGTLRLYQTGDANWGNLLFDSTNGFNFGDKVRIGGALTGTSSATFTGNLTIPAGNAIFLDGGGDSKIEEFSANKINIQAGGDSLIIDGSGSSPLVGIGTNSPATQMSANTFLEIKKASGIAGLGLNGGGDSRWELTSDTGDDFKVSRNGSTKLTIDGSTSKATFTGDLQISDDLYFNSVSAWLIASGGGGTLRVQTFAELEVDGFLDVNGTGQSTFAGAVSTGDGGTNSSDWTLCSKTGAGGTISNQGGAGYFALGDSYTTGGAILMVRNDGDRGSRGNAGGSSLFKASFNDYDALVVDKNGYVTKPNHPAFSAYSSTAGGSGLANDQIFAAIDLNTGSHYNGSNGRFTAPVTGVYHFAGQLLSNAGALVRCDFQINGTSIRWSEQTHGTNSGVTAGYAYSGLALTRQLTAGDYVNLHSSYTNYGGGYSFFSGHLVG